MKLRAKFRLALLALLPALIVTENSVAQGGIVIVEGQQKSLAVIPNGGETYAWRIYNKPTLQTTDLVSQSEVEYSIASIQPILPVLWKRQGDYYFTVTVFNSNGCKNMKVGYVRVILPSVLASAGEDAFVGVCSSYIIDASQSKGDGLSYHWDVLDPGGNLSSNNNVKTSLTLSSSYKGSLPLSIRILLTATNKFGAFDTDTMVVTFGPAPNVGIVYPNNPNKDGSMVIDGSASNGQGLKYHWSSVKGEIVGDANKPKALIKGAGIYSLEVIDDFGCTSVKSFQYPFEPNELIANADYVRTSWVDSVHIHVLNNDYSSRNDIDKRTLSVLSRPTYGTLQVDKDGGMIYTPNTRKAIVDHFIYQICDSDNVCDSALVTIDIFDGPVWIPEAISPNGDGNNELFVIRGLDKYKYSSLVIYTRSGQLIYKSDDYQNDWSGKSQNSALNDGTILPTGTYYYILRLGGTNRYLKGFVYLLK